MDVNPTGAMGAERVTHLSSQGKSSQLARLIGERERKFLSSEMIQRWHCQHAIQISI